MSKQPIKHHYVPAFYLSLFTSNGKRLWVFDKNQRQCWPSSPKNAAKERHFYSVEGTDDPAAVEKLLSDVEGKSAPVVRKVIDTQKLPAGDDLDILINFVALAAVRGPKVREQFARVVDQMTKQVVLPDFLGPSGANLIRDLDASDGEEIADDQIREMQEFIEGGQFDVNLDQTWHIGTTLELFNRVLESLAQRQWAVWTIADGLGDFVCSDQPVVLWDFEWPPDMPPNFAAPNTLLTIPLSRRVMLASCFGGLRSDFVIDDEIHVARMNTIRAVSANQIYSATEDWTWTSDNETVESRQYRETMP